MAEEARKRGRQKSHRHYGRSWENLPSAALLTVFRRTDLEDRFRTIPLVCKSWKSVSEHPQFWSSMIPDSISPEDVFIEQSCRSCREVLTKYFIKLCHTNEEEAKLTLTELSVHKVALGVSRLETLIRKSGRGDAITSLYLSPFISHHYFCGQLFTNTERVLRLITDCCPNLKHISFYGCFVINRQMEAVDVTEEALIELIRKCKRLELIDFDYIRSIHDSSSFMLKLANCLPHLRGIRIQSRDFWGRSCPVAHDVAKYLPRLKLLNLAQTRVNRNELFSILSGCRELQYLNIEGSSMSDIHDFKYNPNAKRSIMDRRLVYKASTQIPDFYFNNSSRPHRTCSSYTRYRDRELV